MGLLDVNKTELANGIAFIRRSKNLSMEDLSSISGVGTYLISNIENKKSNPNFTTISKICESVGMTVSEFYVIISKLNCVR